MVRQGSKHYHISSLSGLQHRERGDGSYLGPADPSSLRGWRCVWGGHPELASIPGRWRQWPTGHQGKGQHRGQVMEREGTKFNQARNSFIVSAQNGNQQLLAAIKGSSLWHIPILPMYMSAPPPPPNLGFEHNHHLFEFCSDCPL